MGDETHKLQKDPPEGSRKTIDRELEREGPELNKRHTGARKYETGEQEEARKPHDSEREGT